MSSPIAIKPLYQKLDACLTADKFRLKRRITQLVQALKASDTKASETKASSKANTVSDGKAAPETKSASDGNVVPKGNERNDEKLLQQFEKLENDIARSAEKKAQRKANLPEVDYPPLPVSDKRGDIKEAIANNQVVIVAGETGSGKTTQLPKICLELGRGVDGMIAHTQPRRLAARSVATRIAE